jgi:hypothetical protein
MVTFVDSALAAGAGKKKKMAKMQNEKMAMATIWGQGLGVIKYLYSNQI